MKKLILFLFLPLSIALSALGCFLLEKLYGWLLTTVYPHTNVGVLTTLCILSVLLVGFICNLLCTLAFHLRPILMQYSATVTLLYVIYACVQYGYDRNVIYMIIGFLFYYSYAIKITYERDYKYKIRS